MVLYSTVVSAKPQRLFALSLTIVPIIRILSLTLPLPYIPVLVVPAVIALPVMIVVWLIVREPAITYPTLGLTSAHLPFEVLLICSAASLASIQYTFLQTRLAVPPFPWPVLVLTALSLIVFTGLLEEIIFRGLLQSLALPILGRWSFLYGAFLYTTISISSNSVVHMLLTFLISLAFGYVVFHGKSVIGVGITRGVSNVIMFLVLPQLAQKNQVWFEQVLLWMMWSGPVLSIVAAGIGLGRAHRNGRLREIAVMGVRKFLGQQYQRGQPKGAFREVRTTLLPSQLSIDSAFATNRASGGHSSSTLNKGIVSVQDITPTPFLLRIDIGEESLEPLRATLVVPTSQDQDLHIPEQDKLQLFAHGHLLVENAGELLPRHFQFVKGHIEVGNLLENVSPDSSCYKYELQRIVRIITARLTKELTQLADHQPAKFRVFWGQYGSYFDQR